MTHFCVTFAARRHAVWVLVIAGILGFRVGLVGFAEWQVAVETAQVVAGIVDYPAGNPFYIYLLVSGLLGMVSFQAWSLIVYALSRDVLLAIGAAFLIFFTRAAEFGVVYPIWLMGVTHTYGVLGLSTIVLAAGLIGAGCYRIGGFLLGVAPAVHPSLGVWFALIVALGLVWEFRKLRDDLRPALKWFLAGCGLTALSLAVQLAFVYDVPSVDRRLSEQYLSAFITFWDGHRRAVALNEPGVMLNIGALMLAVIWINAFAEHLSRSALFLLRIVIVSAALSLGLVVISWIPPDRLPTSLLILMPSRVLNFNAGIFAALLIGLIGASRHRLWSPLLMLLLTVGLLLSDRSMLWDRIARNSLEFVRQVPTEHPVTTLQMLTIAAAALILCAGVSTWRTLTPVLFATRGVRAATLGLLVLVAAPTWLESGSQSAIFLDRTNSPVFWRAAKGEGLLLTGGDLHLIQLRTRRPVILNGGALDGLPYAREAGPETQRILRDIYAIDLLNPPAEARGRGAIPNELNRITWEGYSRQKWQEISRSYHVTQVLTSRWYLNLPAIAWERTLVLYEIPPE